MEQLDATLQPLVRGSAGSNLFSTLGHHPALARRFMRFGNHFLAKGVLPPRDRELVILRTAWNLGAAYEWGHHVRIGAQAGLTRAEIDRIARAGNDPEWRDFDRALIQAADELYREHTISDAGWAALAHRYGPEQLLELVMLVGEYVMVGTLLLAVGIQPEPGLEGLPVPRSQRE